MPKNDCEILSCVITFGMQLFQLVVGCPYFLFSDLASKYVLVYVKMNDKEVDAGFDFCN
jgi:hypothetical protein